MATATENRLRIHGENPAPLLEAVFARIQEERMADVPILNPRLAVEAVNFTRWQGHWLGVLVTPWFMNLVLLPGAQETWVWLPEGAKRGIGFPCGSFEFIAGFEARLGEYLACSLFSPVLEFENQEAARLTALAALEVLQNPGFADPQQRDGDAGVAVMRPDAPLSKRDFLRGGFLRSER
ncbi:MAG: [NiFe]-hydrogenase assembly chaperone HybE [Betaproteobacteria bacterium]|nr:[NiFe]-hydrogenase assembly chaperone HybE [Betaproteobacteria bacterium]